MRGEAGNPGKDLGPRRAGRTSRRAANGEVHVHRVVGKLHLPILGLVEHSAENQGLGVRVHPLDVAPEHAGKGAHPDGAASREGLADCPATGGKRAPQGFGFPERNETAYALRLKGGSHPRAAGLLSLARNEPVRRIAMTGEITLTGEVFPIGGVREKLIAARRAGIKEILLPEDNRGEYEEVPEHIRKGLKIHFVSRFEDVVPLLFAERPRRPAQQQ